MKIEQAVEKAKKKKLEAHRQKGRALFKSSRLSKDFDNNWTPPVYQQSRSHALDYAMMCANRCVCYQKDAPELDYYKLLRTQLTNYAQDRGVNTIMITSAQPGEGKTVTSINLAMTFAKAYNQTVILVDCDLRQQKVYRYMGIPSHKGIIDHILDDCPLRDMIIWPRIEKMTLISGGRTVKESAELLGSPKMKSMLSEMKARYQDRYILLDAPPVLVGADAMILATIADAVIMVVESGKTPIKEIQEALDLIPKDKFFGFVLNKHTSKNKRYYNYYMRSSGD